MRYHIVTAVIGLVATFGAAWLAEPEVCVEDMVCWDWRTMGNGCHGIDEYGTIECQPITTED